MRSIRSFLSAAVNANCFFTSEMSDCWPLDQRFSGTPLHYAAARGFDEGIVLLISYGGDINALDYHNRSPLIIAAEGGQDNVAIKLLDAGADTHLFDSMSRTALMWAVKNGNRDLIEFLGKAKLALKATDDYGFTVLHFAAGLSTTATKMFHHFVAQGVDPLYRLHPGAPNAVSHAFDIASGNPSLMAFILNSGLLAGTEADDPIQLLSCAVKENHPRLLRKLLQIMCRYGMLQIQINRMTHRDHSPLCVAAMAGNISCLKELINAGADIDAGGCYQGSALMAAAAHGRLESIKHLVRAGASIEHVDDQGIRRHALDVAWRYRHAISWLLVGRFRDQIRLTAQSHWQDDQNAADIVKPWSGPCKAEWRLTGDKRRRRDESRLDYLCLTEQFKYDARGLIMV